MWYGAQNNTAPTTRLGNPMLEEIRFENLQAFGTIVYHGLVMDGLG